MAVSDAYLRQLTGGYDAPNTAVNKIARADYTRSDPWPAVKKAAAPAKAAAAASTPVDPYAQWGGIDQFNAYKNQYTSGISNVGTGAGEAFGTLGSTLQGSAEDIFNKYRVGQQGIDTSRANNELNRITSMGDIVGYVRNGIRQGYSRLANSNSVDSSAAGALEGAYSQLGTSKARGVNNQAAIQSHSIDQDQANLGVERGSDVHAFQRQHDQGVAAIGADVRNKLAVLDQGAIGLSLPDRVNIDAEKQRIINEGKAKIAGAGEWLQSKLGTINPQNNEQIIAQANQLQQAGTNIANPFSTGPTDRQQVIGPAIDQLPIFVSRRRRT
jgi:hypothetical protein